MKVEITVDIDQALKLSESKFQEIFYQGMEAAVYKALELVPPSESSNARQGIKTNTFR
jgi:hypothetical protein